MIAQFDVGVVHLIVQKEIFIEGQGSRYFRVHMVSGKKLIV